MDRFYTDRLFGTGWTAHGGGGGGTGDDGGPLKRRRTGEAGNFAVDYASIVRPLARLVRDSVDNVIPSSLSESFGGLAVDDRHGFSQSAADHAVLSEEQQERFIQQERLRAATAHGQWLKAAQELDKLDGCDQWKREEQTDDYDVETLKLKLAELDSARSNEDLARMLTVLRQSLGRDVAGIGNSALYRRSRVGTKELIERYVASAIDTIESAMRIAAQSRKSGTYLEGIEQRMKDTRQAYGRTALLLSGGGTFGMMHIGVVKAMYEADVLPRIISGASAGSIVASVLCSRTDEEIPQILQDFCNGDLNVFAKTEEDASWKRRLFNLFTQWSLYDIKHLEDVMKGHLGNMTFLEAYNRTQRILSIAVSSDSAQDTPELLTYVTAPNVLIWSAVAASCSVPFVYKPATLLQKDPKTGEVTAWGGEGKYYIDGSVSHDLPIDRLREMLDVNHFIVSQVNPHIVPFLKKEQNFQDPAGRTMWQVLTDNASDIARREVVHGMELLKVAGTRVPSMVPTFLTNRLPQPPHWASQLAGKMGHFAVSILNQKYTGDITILPEVSLNLVLKVLSNPTPEFMAESMAKGERATWPEIDRIRSRTGVERAIDTSVRTMREQVAFSPSQVDLRINRMQRTASAQRHHMRRITNIDDARRSAATMPLAHDSVSTRSAVPHRAVKLLYDAPSRRSSIKHTRTRSNSSSSDDETIYRSRSTSRPPHFTGSSTSPPPSGDDDSDDDHIKIATGHQQQRPYQSASQPASPGIRSRGFPFSPSPSSPASELPASLAMTLASSQPSVPEQRYKTLFHGVKGLSVLKPRAATPGSEALSAETTRRRPNFTLRSPGGRRPSAKRSESTGMKGLKPPKRQ